MWTCYLFKKNKTKQLWNKSWNEAGQTPNHVLTSVLASAHLSLPPSWPSPKTRLLTWGPHSHHSPHLHGRNHPGGGGGQGLTWKAAQPSFPSSSHVQTGHIQPRAMRQSQRACSSKSINGQDYLLNPICLEMCLETTVFPLLFYTKRHISIPLQILLRCITPRYKNLWDTKQKEHLKYCI